MKKLLSILVVSLFFAAFSLSACAAREPVLIGFAAQLTGRQGELGVAARNGAQLAVEQINQNGGIHGRPIHLLVADDLGNPEAARRADQELIDQGVVAIIGHVTSEQTAAVFKMINQQEMILLSPTSSSQAFTGKDDFFFRVMPDNSSFAQLLARRIYKAGGRNIVCIYDLSNRSFTETFWRAMEAEFNRLGVSSQLFQFSSGETDLKALMQEVAGQNPDAVAYIASAVDTALMAQYGSLLGMTARQYGNTWSYTQELLEKGGRAVEGMELVALYNPQYESPKHQQFIRDFQEKYGKPPSLGASHSYEATLVLAEALKASRGERQGLREALGEIQNFEGLVDPISLDAYGDVQRLIFVARVEDGKFVITDTIQP